MRWWWCFFITYWPLQPWIPGRVEPAKTGTSWKQYPWRSGCNLELKWWRLVQTTLPSRAENDGQDHTQTGGTASLGMPLAPVFSFCLNLKLFSAWKTDCGSPLPWCVFLPNVVTLNTCPSSQALCSLSLICMLGWWQNLAYWGCPNRSFKPKNSSYECVLKIIVVELICLPSEKSPWVQKD